MTTVFEYKFYEDEEEPAGEISGFDEESIAEDMVEEHNNDSAEYPEDNEIWLREIGTEKWRKFNVYAEVRTHYRATEEKK